MSYGRLRRPTKTCLDIVKHVEYLTLIAADQNHQHLGGDEGWSLAGCRGSCFVIDVVELMYG